VNTGAADAESVLGGRYRLITPVGTGGMAVVWRARDEVLGRTVAVKVLTAEYAGDQESRDRIRHEARAAATLSHPNIAHVHDYGETGEAGEVFPYVVMELVPGGTLLERLAAGPVAPKYAMRICSEIAAALAAAHAEGLVHRDVKLANVMLAPTGAKVVDFGIAAVAAPSGSGAVDSALFGTPAYLAPERLIDDAVEPASDVYALGVVLYRLLAGHSPWTTESTTQMLTAHIYVDPAPLPPTNGVPEYIRELCDRCLAKDPTTRPSAREAAALLGRAAGLRDVADMPSAAVEPAPAEAPVEPATVVPAAADAVSVSPDPAPHRTPARRWAVAAALLVLAGGLAWSLFPDATSTADAQPPTAGGTSPAALPSPAAPTSGVPKPAPSAAPSRPAPTQSPRGGHAEPTSRPSTTAPAPRPTRSSPAPSSPAPTTPTTTAEPDARVLTSVAGTVRATCPSPGTAQILSYSAIDPYQVRRVQPGPGPAPRVVFRNGSSRVVMIVTCDAGVPSLTVN
jgi:serine/threonine protein kinase